jgi:hypothetical protein
MEKEIGKELGGYTIYEIDIPKKYFTNSFNPTGKNKIIKINKDNIDEYIRFKNELKIKSKFIEEMQKRNLIGVESTFVDSTVTGNAYKTNSTIITPYEGYIWKKPQDIKISICEIL